MVYQKCYQQNIHIQIAYIWYIYIYVCVCVRFKIPHTDFKMKINKYILQQRKQRWNNNENNKLLEIKPTLGEWKQSLKNRKEKITLSRFRIGHTRITHFYLLEGKQQPICYACQTKYTVKYILTKWTDLAHIRKTFYRANNMKELFQKTEINNVIFLKTVKLYTKIWRNLP